VRACASLSSHLPQNPFNHRKRREANRLSIT
jgi:hypothetical protein